MQSCYSEGKARINTSRGVKLVKILDVSIELDKLDKNNEKQVTNITFKRIIHKFDHKFSQTETTQNMETIRLQIIVECKLMGFLA